MELLRLTDKSGIVDECCNYGMVSSTKQFATGGIVGGNGDRWAAMGTIERCSNYGEIKGGTEVGGIVGYGGNGVRIVNCLNFGTSTGKSYSGGIMGLFSGDEPGFIENCYNLANINSLRDNNVGGILGKNGSTSAKITITSCYDIGECFSNSSTSLGINITLDEGELTTITNSYYLNEELSGGRKIDENFMKSQAFVDMLGDAYTMDTKGINNGYPILKWQLGN